MSAPRGMASGRFSKAADPLFREINDSPYAETMFSFEGEEVYSQKDAGGFVRSLSLPERTRALKHNQGER